MPAAATVALRQAIEKSDVLQVACDSYPLWLRKRPADDAHSHRFQCVAQPRSDGDRSLRAPHYSAFPRHMPPEAFRPVGPPPAMRSPWKMSFFYSVRNSRSPPECLH